MILPSCIEQLLASMMSMGGTVMPGRSLERRRQNARTL
jgi:hypothetical protein